MAKKPMVLLLSLVMMFSFFLPFGNISEAATKQNLADKIIQTGYRYKGTPYKFGAPMSAAPRYFDCSSFTKYVYAKYGINLPRVSAAQAKVGKYVPKSQLRKGDLVYFRVPSRGKGVGHVAIYIGNGYMLGTYGAGGVKVSKINGYWERMYLGARRVL